MATFFHVLVWVGIVVNIVANVANVANAAGAAQRRPSALSFILGPLLMIVGVVGFLVTR